MIFLLVILFAQLCLNSSLDNFEEDEKANIVRVSFFEKMLIKSDSFLLRVLNSFYSPTLVFIILQISFLLLFLLFRRFLRVIRYCMSHNRGFVAGLLEVLFPFAQKVPFVSSKVDKESKKLLKNAISWMSEKGEVKDKKFNVLPKKGLEAEVILEKAKTYINSVGNFAWKERKCSGTVYMVADEKHRELLNQVYSVYSIANALHYNIFPSICKFEREIIKMTASILHGDKDTRGIVTCGGTESIILALKAYRDLTRKERPWIKEPYNIIAPNTMHVALDKGGHMFGVDIIKVPVEKDTYKVDPKNLEKRINKRTIALYASAPCYPTGIIDDIAAIGKIAEKHKLFFHVDCCLGGFYLPFAYEMDVGVPEFDFLVKGVTSISADTHKYGQSPKGTSVVLFRNEKIRNRAFYFNHEWPGGIYGTPTILGSRSGGILAACWASLLHQGYDGYAKTAKNIHETVREIVVGCQDIKGVEVTGDPKAMIVGLKSTDKKISSYQIMDEMHEKGWHLNAFQYPSGFHLCVTSRVSGMGKVFLSDLKESCEVVRMNPKIHSKNSAAVYGNAGLVPHDLFIKIFDKFQAYFLDGTIGEDENEKN